MFMKTKPNKVGRILSPTELTLQREKREEDKVNGSIVFLFWILNSTNINLRSPQLTGLPRAPLCHTVPTMSIQSYRWEWDNSILLSLYFENNSFICFLLLCHDFLLFIHISSSQGTTYVPICQYFWILVAFYFYIFFMAYQKNKTSTLCHPIYTVLIHSGLN